MDLIKRIEKLEDKAGIRNPMPYCTCNGDRQEYQTYIQSGPDSEPMRDGKPYRKDEAQACDRCKKPIRRSVIIIDIVPSVGPVPTGTATFAISNPKGVAL